jgi:hypothetical protein
MAHIAVKGLLTRMLPLFAVSHRAWPSDLLPLSVSYMAGNCQNVRLWDFGHDCYTDGQNDGLPLVYLSFTNE